MTTNSNGPMGQLPLRGQLTQGAVIRITIRRSWLFDFCQLFNMLIVALRNLWKRRPIVKTMYYTTKLSTKQSELILMIWGYESRHILDTCDMWYVISHVISNFKYILNMSDCQAVGTNTHMQTLQIIPSSVNIFHMTCLYIWTWTAIYSGGLSPG